MNIAHLHCSSQRDNWGVCAFNNGIIELIKTTFVDIAAESTIHASNLDSLVVRECDFKDLTGGNLGGAIYSSNNLDNTIENSTFENN